MSRLGIAGSAGRNAGSSQCHPFGRPFSYRPLLVAVGYAFNSRRNHSADVGRASKHDTATCPPRHSLGVRLPSRIAASGSLANRCVARSVTTSSFRNRGQAGHELGHEALRRWLRRPGANPAALLKLAASFPRGVTALRKALEILL